MALSLVPSNYQSLSSTFNSQFQYFRWKTHSSKCFRGQKLRISCCRRTVQIDDERQQRSNLVKKNRKPRPSFLEQIQNKWSLKYPSLRENFPWEVQESDGSNLEFQLQELESSGDISSEREDEKNSSEPVNHHAENELILAPWVNGNGTRNKLLGEAILDMKTEEKCGKLDETEVGLPGNDDMSSKTNSADKDDEMILPWESKKHEEFVEEKSRSSNTEVAERLIPEPELKRLRNVSLRMVARIKVGAAGVTQALVGTIHEKWKNEEMVKLKFEGSPSMNMKRTHEILENRTGGLVIWRSGSLVVIYRGMQYKLDCVKSYPGYVKDKCRNGAADSSRLRNSITSKNYDKLPKEEQTDMSELSRLLDELGPKFTDWSGREPIPVDADLLPAVVPGYKTPFRLLPYGTRQTLRDREMTHLRRTARMMPPHFVLGRSRELQGLAMAMVKLWEKSAIAKIAIKRGVQNTNNERMAEELKILTGGTLLSRNKEFIVFYRGNDFLPPGVSSALIEAEKHAALKQDEEDQARDRAATMINSKTKTSARPFIAGTLTETVAATSRWGSQPNSAEIEKMMRDATVARHASLVNSLQRKLARAKGKIGIAEKALQKVLENQEPENLPTDLETLTDEERFLLRRIGLSMKPYLLLGRREIFDGTIENMHLHWKFRELVKIIVKGKSFPRVKHIAVSLEAESGGVLVSVDKTEKGYAIIVYRGKNYQRPLAFRPRNLLTKRQALARSIELQRREALKHHVMELEERVKTLKQELDDMTSANGSPEADTNDQAA